MEQEVDEIMSYDIEYNYKSPSKTFFKYLKMFLVAVFFGFVLMLPIAYFSGFKPVLIVSGSMTPVIAVDSLIIVKKPPEASLKVGDIITYKLDGSSTFVTHRIHTISEGVIVTKGDTNSTLDDDITYKNVYGKVVYIMPTMGRIVTWLTNYLNLFQVVCAFIVIYYLWQFYKYDME